MPNRSKPSLAPLSLSAKARRTHDSPISSLMASALANPELISFAAGFVDPLTLPLKESAAISQRIFGDPQKGRSALQYDTTLGLKPLRSALLVHLESLEDRSGASLGFTAEDI